jgi:putative ATP-binding cassette transporter
MYYPYNNRDFTMKQYNFTFISQVWTYLIRPYWTSRDRWLALGLLISQMVLIGFFVYLSILLNYWGNDFYTALQELNGKAFFSLLGTFTILAFLSIAAFMMRSYLLQILELRWRKWMTQHFLDRWTHNKRYYALQLQGDGTDNPDQRIADDTRQFINSSLALTLGFFEQICTLCAFLGVLWALSGALTFTLGGIAFVIPGYMFWAALLYAVGGSFVSHYLGRPLIRLDYTKEKREADFRYSLVRFRENMEGVALYQGEAREREIFGLRINQIVKNFHEIINRSFITNTWKSFYGQVDIIFPALLAAPRLFAKEISFGGLMQTLSAFNHVSTALAFFVDNYPSIAAWQATTNRLLEFKHYLETDLSSSLIRTVHDAPEIRVSCERVSLPHGVVLHRDVQLVFKQAEHTLITGPTGIGKSTLARVIAGLWTYGEGKVTINNDPFLFLPQKPYMPLGSLNLVLHYPSLPGKRRAETEDVLRAVGLEAFISRLDEVNDWARVLSLGEQQRIAIARAMLSKPQWLFLDEATSAMDEGSEAQLYRTLKAYLPTITLISIGHRESLKSLHDREIRLGGNQCAVETEVA